MNCIRRQLLWAALLGLLTIRVGGQEVLWNDRHNYSFSAPLAAGDINLDGKLEIVMVSPENRVALVSPSEKRIAWEASITLNGKLMTAATIGHFLDDGSMDIAVMASDGHVLILDGATGQIRAEHHLFFEPLDAGTLLPIRKEDIGTPWRDGLLVVKPAGTLLALMFNAGSPTTVLFQVDIGGLLNHPAALGKTSWSAPEPHILNVSSTGKITLVSATAAEPKVLSMLIERVTFQDTWSALGDVTGDGSDDIVVADGAGFVHAFAVKGDEIVPLWERVSIDSKPMNNPVLADADGNGSLDILVPKDEKTLLLVNGATGARDLWKSPAYNHDFAIKSSLGVFHGAGGKAFAIFGDENPDFAGLTVFDIRTGTVMLAGEKPLRLETGETSNYSPVVGGISGGEGAEVFALGWLKGTGSYAKLGIPQSADMPAWLGHRGGPFRTSAPSKIYHNYIAGQSAELRKRVDAQVAKARTSLEQGDTAAAMEALTLALAASPNHPEANELYSSAKLKKNLLKLILGGVLGLGALGAVVWLGAGFGMRYGRKKRIQGAIARGDKVQAADLLLALHKGAPTDKENLKTLADLLVDLKRFNPETTDVMQKAHEMAPAEERYVRGLGECYLASGKKDKDSARIFARLVSMEQGTGILQELGKWAFALGQSYYEMREDQKALDAFREAKRARFDDPRMAHALADLYVRMGVTQSEVLPILGRVLEERQNDKAFLATYCRAARDHKVFDETSRRAARLLLERDPGSMEAHVILAEMLLKDGNTKESLRHAEAILERDPNDSIGLRLLGAGYAAEGRLDETAMRIFRRALETNPEAQEILRAVSRAYIQEGRKDEEALDVYVRTLATNPNEETILEHVSEIAAERKNDDLIIETGERLLQLGHHSRKLVLQLADAYCRRGVLVDSAEAVYREALLFQPDHATVATNLATIYARKKRLDEEAMAVYETAYTANPKLREIGRMLAFTYAKAEMSDRTLALAQRLSAEDPNDNDIKRLLANAAVTLDNMDSAIQNYEQILETSPEDMETTCRLAELYGKKRLHDPKALKVYQRAARTMKDNLPIHAALARAWAKQGNWEQVVATIKHYLSHAPRMISSGIQLMEELVEGAPKALDLRWFLVDTLTYDGRLKDAINHLIGILKINTGEAKRALAAFEKILDKNPKEAVAHQYRGRLLFELNRGSEARQALEVAFRLAPQDEAIARDLMILYEKLLERSDSPDLRFQLGKVALALGKHDVAISCFQKTDKDPRWENPSIKALARCFMAKGMLDLSLQEIRRLGMDEEVKELLYELGQRYEAVNDMRGAREVYKMIFAVDIGYQDVKGKLESLENREQDVMTAERTAIINALSEQAKARYELLEELGRGAMGIVYKARDSELDEVVALKILPESLGNHPEALRRFRQEARNARHLAHPNIVRIHDIGEEMGRKYISMEFVNGSDLKQRLVACKRKMPITETINFTRQIVSALSAAHDAGIVHRDIKPANIMITKEGKVKVTDFGIAKAMEEDTHHNVEATKIGSIVGTPLYMSPEQVQGSNVDYRSDIYSLGVMLYELASGYPPFTEGDLAYHHVFTEPKPLEGIPPDFASLILKCLKKKPNERWQSAHEMMEAMRLIP